MPTPLAQWQDAVHAYADGHGTVGALLQAGAVLADRLRLVEVEYAAVHQDLDDLRVVAAELHRDMAALLRELNGRDTKQ